MKSNNTPTTRWSFASQLFVWLMLVSVSLTGCQSVDLPQDTNTPSSTIQDNTTLPARPRSFSLQGAIGSSKQQPMLPAALRAKMLQDIQNKATVQYTIQSPTLASTTAYVAHNPSQQLALRFGERSLSMSKESWSLDLQLSAIGRGATQQATSVQTRTVKQNRVTYTRRLGSQSIQEWYVNGPLGVEQGFTLPKRPFAEQQGQLTFHMKLRSDLTASWHVKGKSIVLRNKAGKAVLYYQELFAKDAKGQTIPSTMKLSGQTITLALQDEGAQYPIEIDPILSTEQKLLPTGTTSSPGFGGALAISGNTIAVGAAGDTEKGNEAGAVFIYIQSGGVWSLQQKLFSSDIAAGDLFGRSIALSGDTLIASSYKDDDNGVESGSVYVFTRSGSTWTQQAKLTASDGAADDWFGFTLAYSGNTIVISAPLADASGSQAGAAYVFTGSGSSWTQQAKLVASDGAADDYLGYACGISGDTIALGAWLDDDKGANSGSVYIFTRSGSTWTQSTKLTASDGVANHWFGVRMDLKGNDLLVTASGDSEKGGNAGAVYVFTNNGGTWTQQAKLTASDGASLDSFGRHVAIDGDIALIGAYYDEGDGGEYRMGSAYIFTRSGTTWTQVEKLRPSDGQTEHRYGQSVAIDGATLAVGAVFGTPQGSDYGKVYLYTDTCTNTTLSSDKSSPQPASGTVTWTANASCLNNAEYKYWYKAPGATSWQLAQDWGANTYNWDISSALTGTYSWQVWSRRVGSTVDYESASPVQTFAITSGQSECTDPTLSPSVASPQTAGTTITWNLSASCTLGGTAEYKVWRRSPAGTWEVAQDWNASNTYNWDTTGTITGTYVFQVWSRSQGSTATFGGTSESASYEITNGTSFCSSVAASFNPTSPQTVGTNVTITGNATCSGSGTAHYKFWLRNPAGSWTLLRDWNATSTYSWDTTGATPGLYVIQVWTREQNSTAAYESYTVETYTLQ